MNNTSNTHRNYSVLMALTVASTSVIGFAYSMKGDILENRNNYIVLNNEFSHLREINKLMISQIEDEIRENGNEYKLLTSRVDTLLSVIKSRSQKQERGN